MDSRHESFEQELLNQLIAVINKYLTENIDELLNHPQGLELIKAISQAIFNHLNMDIEVDGIITKKNLLSIDVVLFPHIEDPLIIDENSIHLIKEIKSMIQNHLNGSKNVDKRLCQELMNIYKGHESNLDFSAHKRPSP